MKLLRALALLVAVAFAAAAPTPSPAFTPNQERLLLSAACPQAARAPGVAQCPNASLNFQTGRYWAKGAGWQPVSGLLSVTRSAPATTYAQDAAGNLIPFAANTARVTNLGLLVEEARTNLQTQSTTGAWGTTNTTLTANAVLAPDGATAASQVADNSTNAAHYYSGTSVAVTSATTYTFSAFLRKGTGNFAQLWTGNTPFSGSGGLTINLATGAYQTFGTVAASGVQIYLDAGGNTWYRPWFAQTATSSASASMAIGLATAITDTRAVVYVGSGSTIFAWGAQAEPGSFPTSYIPTTTLAVARSADIPQLIGAAATAALAAKAAFFQTFGNEGITSAARLLDNGSRFIYYTNSTQGVLSDGTHATTATSGSGTISDMMKVATAMDTSGGTMIMNGGTKASNASISWSSSGTLYLGNVAAGNRALNGYMQRFALSPVKGAFDGATSP